MPRKPKRDPDRNKPHVGFGLLGYLADRRESLQLRLRVEEPTRPELQSAIKAVLGKDPPPMQADDTLNLDYKLEVDYFGSVAQKLTGILELAEAGVAIEGDVTVLTQGKSLIVEVLNLLQELPNYLPIEGEHVEKIGYENEKSQGSS